MSFVFNSFKQRFLNGQVPSADTWRFIPVNRTFQENFGQDDFALEQYRSLSDFYAHNSSAMTNAFFGGISSDLAWRKVLDSDTINKPMFITSGVKGDDGYEEESNWESFTATEYYDTVSANSSISSYLESGGFYYIRTKDELKWFGDRANTGNNRIIGVLGDGIEGVMRGQIGSAEDYPFQGVLDGNGYSLNNIQIICDNDDNGLVGILGEDGVVKNFKIMNDENSPINLVCQKQINLDYLKTDGRDINAGILVGRNYGTIENIDAGGMGRFKFSGFVPQVYSVTNKSDDYSDFSTIREKFDNGENFYFLNSWCVNSPGNISPYVGYFAEGVFAESGSMMTNDGKKSIELHPAMKAKYNLGLNRATVTLSNKLSKVGLYFKAVDDNSTDYNARRYVDNLGRNCIFLAVYDAVIENGTKTKVVLEINGVVYDKKSGTGKRRYYFHGGHYDIVSTLPSSYDSFVTDYEDDEDFEDNQFVKKFTITDNVYPENNKTYYIPLAKNYDDGKDDSFDDEEELDDSYYEISENDIEAYTENGIPVIINDKNFSTIFYAPRNKSTSTAVWNTFTWSVKLVKKSKIDFVYNGVNYYYIVDLDDEFLSFNAFFNTGNTATTYRNKMNYYTSEGSVFTEDPSVPMQKALIQTILDDYFSARNYSTFELNDLNSYSLYNGGARWRDRMIIDEQDESFFESYITKRDFWKCDDDYDLLKSQDVLINSDNGIRSEGTIETTVLEIENFQYRPFVHTLNETTTFQYGDEPYYINLNPGTIAYLVSSYFSTVTASAEAKSLALDYISNNVKYYVNDPLYYGLDKDGRWTTNSIRAVPRDSLVESLGDGPIRPNTINYNWNIIERLFDTDEEKFSFIKDYVAYDDGDDPGFYNTKKDNSDSKYSVEPMRCDLLSKKILGTPLRMHNMARAAYYVSPIAGSNYGKISNVYLKGVRSNVGNFVGFIGSIAGKQERGEVRDIAVSVNDEFVYFENPPTKPNSASMTTSAYESAFNEFTAKSAAYNFQVRYKQTPIIPTSVSESIDDVTVNPDDEENREKYRFYPQNVINEELVDDYVSNEEYDALESYLSSNNVTMYNTAANETAKFDDFVIESYTANLSYQYDKTIYDFAKPIVTYTSAWYDDYTNTATEVYDDVITYNLRPIINAGGLFGKIVPTNTYDSSRINISDVNVEYGRLKPASLTNQTVFYNFEDIHNTYGTLAGLLEIQTSELGNDSNEFNKLNLTNINAVSVNSLGEKDESVAMFGFMAYQPTELNSVIALRDSPRNENKDEVGMHTNTTWALDIPVAMNRNEVIYDSNVYLYSPINQSSAAYFISPNSSEDINGSVSGGTLNSSYMKDLFDGIFNKSGVNTNASAAVYANPSANDIGMNNSKNGPISIQSKFGSNVNFRQIGTSQETLEFCSTRVHSMNKDNIEISDVVTGNATAFIQNNVILNSKVMNKTDSSKDDYFDYTYTKSSGFKNDWTFTENVMFTSAIRDEDNGDSSKSFNEKISIGYVFSDELDNPADGFVYQNNYLHIGNSVSPSYIRSQTSAIGSVLHTSSCSAAYYNDDGELVAADRAHMYDGMLVVDSSGRTVMFLDNNNNNRVDNGSLNIECDPCTFNGERGGLLLEIK